MARRIWTLVVCAALVIGWAALPAEAKNKKKSKGGSEVEAGEQQPDGPREQMRADLKALAAQIKNAEMKVKHVLAAREGNSDSRLRKTSDEDRGMSVTECCQSNLDAIAKRMDSFVAKLRTLHDEATRRNDEDALNALAQIAGDVRDMSKAYEAFSAARGSFHAEKTHSALSGTYRNVRRSFEDYMECCVGVQGG